MLLVAWHMQWLTQCLNGSIWQQLWEGNQCYGVHKGQWKGEICSWYCLQVQQLLFAKQLLLKP